MSLKRKIFSGHFGMDDLDFHYFKIIHKENYGPIISCLPGVVVIPKKMIQNIWCYGMIEIRRDAIEKIGIEFPGGQIELNELPEKGAIRELHEETGLTGIPKLIGNFYEAPGKMNFLHYVVEVYLDESYNLTLNKEEGISKFHFLKKNEIFKNLQEGKIISGATLSALNFIENN